MNERVHPPHWRRHIGESRCNTPYCPEIIVEYTWLPASHAEPPIRGTARQRWCARCAELEWRLSRAAVGRAWGHA